MPTTQEKLSQFASEEFPLRISSLPKFIMCPMSVVYPFLKEFDDRAADRPIKRTSGEAADTGTAVGKAIELWHRQRGSVKDMESVVIPQVMRDAAHEFPKLNRKKVTLVAIAYANDPRNDHSRIVMSSLEREYRLRYEHSTGPIVLTGHTDQLRVPEKFKNEAEAEWLTVWDSKHSWVEGWEIVNQYAWQLSLYAVAATQAYKKPVQPGGIILTSRYSETADEPKYDSEGNEIKRKRGQHDYVDPAAATVFWTVPWDLDLCYKMADALIDEIVRYRTMDAETSIPIANPGRHCVMCEHKGLANCMPAWGKLVADARKPVADESKLLETAKSLNLGSLFKCEK